jgi:FixJ family two-component response regulator
MPQNAASKGEIFVFDDEAETRESLSMVLREEGYEVICFADGAALLSLARARVPACVFLEVRIPDKFGLDILKTLRSENYPAPIFMISGQGDISMAVEAIKSGAIDFIEKPFRSSEIIARVKAIDTLSRVGGGKRYPKTFLPYVQGREPLTRRERQVLEQIAAGASNKEAGRQLGISPRTIEDHRTNIMKKVGVKNAAELIRRVLSDS